MAAQPQTRPPFTADDFLTWEATQPERHEYIGGETFAMAGGTDHNNTVALNLALALRQHLRGTPCGVFLGEVKLEVEAASAFFYPDVFVTCTERDAADRLVKRDAKLVIEVVSPATEAYDRGEKFVHYRALPTLQEYVLVDVAHRRIDVHRRGADGLWVLHPFHTGDRAFTLASVDLSLPLEALYQDVPDEAAPPPGPLRS